MIALTALPNGGGDCLNTEDMLLGQHSAYTVYANCVCLTVSTETHVGITSQQQ